MTLQEAITGAKTWLAFYGLTIADDSTDDVMLTFLAEKMQNYILAQTNQSVVPEGLNQVWVELIAGEFLARKKATGSIDGFDLDAAESSIKIGDTTVQFGDGTQTDEERLDSLINKLTKPEKAIWARYRRLVW